MTTPPDALLLIAPGCPHCPGMLEALAKLLKEGVIGRLEVVNVAIHPEQAQARGVRGVPWLQLGPFTLEGLTSPEMLRRWAERATRPEGMIDYLEGLLADGRLAEAEQRLAQAPQHLPALIARVGDLQLPIQVRLGIGALVEGLEGSDALAAALPPLAQLSTHGDPRVRADACHFLGFTRRPEACAPLRVCLADAHPEVREIAEEALDRLGCGSDDRGVGTGR